MLLHTVLAQTKSGKMSVKKTEIKAIHPSTVQAVNVINNIIKVQLLYNTSKKPTKKTPQSVGLDIYSSQNMILLPGETSYVSTGISLECPKGTYARITSKAKLAALYKIHAFGGVVDPDYRGEIIVLLNNYSDSIFQIDVGDEIAQIVLEKYADCSVEVVDKLSFTTRGKSAGIIDAMKADEAINFIKNNYKRNLSENQGAVNTIESQEVICPITNNANNMNADNEIDKLSKELAEIVDAPVKFEPAKIEAVHRVLSTEELQEYLQSDYLFKDNKESQQNNCYYY